MTSFKHALPIPVIFLLTISLSAQVKFERDFNLTPELSSISEWVEIDGKMYFSANDGYFGYELWQFDPSTEQATRLTDLRKQGGNSNPKDLIGYDGKVFFIADTDEHFRQLFYFDPQTWQVQQAAPFFFDDYQTNATALYNGKLWFTGHFDGRINLWNYDAATDIFTEIPAPAGGHTTNFLPGEKMEFNGRLYFSGRRPDGRNVLWAYDDATGIFNQEPTQFDDDPTIWYWEPSIMLPCNGKLMMFVEYNYSKRWHYYDEATDSCIAIHTNSPGVTAGVPACLQDKFWFDASGIKVFDPATGETKNLNQIIQGVPASLRNMKVLGDELFFQGYLNSNYNTIWRYHPGTGTVTQLPVFSDVFTRMYSLMQVGDTWYAIAENAVEQEVFKFSTTGNDFSMVADINKASRAGFLLYNTTLFHEFDGRMYFNAEDSTSTNYERSIWVKDLASGQFSSLTNSLQGNRRPYIYGQTAQLGGRFYFSGENGGSSDFRQLVSYQTGEDSLTWHGTVQPNISLQGITPYLRNMTTYNGKLFFNTWKDYNSTQFFQFDPASQTIDIVPGMEQATGGIRFISQDKLYFSGGLNGEFDNHLYSFDLVNGGFTEIANDSILSSPFDTYLVGDKIAYLQYTPFTLNGQSIRLYDPATGTYSDVLPQGFSYIDFRNPVLFQGKYWFASQYFNTYSLFWLDPATGTCEQALDLAPYSLTAYDKMVVFDGKLYFVGSTLEYGRELYEYDPATNDIRLYADINPGGGDSNPEDFAVAGNRLYFTANDGWRGHELWSLANCFAVSLTAVPDSLGQQTGQISLTTEGGTAPFSFSWNNGATTQDLTGLASGYYEATVTDAAGCEATVFTVLEGGLAVGADELTKTVQIKVFPNPLAASQELQISLENDFRGMVKIDFLGMDGRVLQSFFEEKTGQRLQVNKEMAPSIAGNLFIVRVSDGSGSAARMVVRF